MYIITRNFIKNKYEELKKESKDLDKEKLKLSFWHHFNNMLAKLEKFLKSVPSARDEIYKSEKKDLKEILNKYLKDTSKSPDHIRCKKVKEFIDEIEKDLKNHKENEKDVIDIKDKKIKYGLFNRKTKITKPLFPDESGMPVLKDVKQGYTDLDCYFLAVLMSVVNKNPKVIMDCFPDYPKNGNKEEIEEFNAGKKIKVRFYKVKWGYVGNDYKCCPDGTVDIILDKTALRGGGAPWVRILEKAFAVYRAKGYDSDAIIDENLKRINSRNIDGLNGGSSAAVMTIITGKPTSVGVWSDDSSRKKFSSKYDSKDLAVFKRIQEALKSGKVITAGAPPRFNKFIPFYSKGLFLGHVYSVFKAEEENGINYITVGNPYKGRTRVYDKKHKSKSVTPKDKEKRGVSRLELNDFLNYFHDIDISDDISK